MAAEPQAFAPVSAVAGLSLEVAVSAADPEAVFVAAEPQVSAGTVVPSVVLVLVSVVVAEVDSSGHPKFLAFPNVDHFASSSSSGEVVG